VRAAAVAAVPAAVAAAAATAAAAAAAHDVAREAESAAVPVYIRATNNRGFRCETHGPWGKRLHSVG